MYLRSLHLQQFRNYRDQAVLFNAPKTILVGNNAQGKSNLLEAVELLATLRSHRASRDRDLVQEGCAMGKVVATLERDISSLDVTLTLRSSGRRTIALNGETLKRHLDFLGSLNAVQFSCLDLDLVRGGPGQRRNWIDGLLVQLEPVYAHILHQYQLVLKQRNALLKQSRSQRQSGAASPSASVGHSPSATDPQQLGVWDAQLVATGTPVIRRRARVIQRILPLAQRWPQAISGQTEYLNLRYLPNVDLNDTPLNQADSASVQQAFLDKIQQKQVGEQQQGTTLVGPHRDEVEFTINQTPARQYGSQGQQRTLVLALKLAELQLIEAVIGEPPLLLLDDVLAELDLDRQNQLLETIQDRFQTLITTTHLGSFDSQWLKSSQILTVRAGHLTAQAIA